jgi:hypothetical protein
MKNRRLNVLFIAIIALAAAPQAMHDAHRLVNAAQERAESEFWSIFLSYTSPESGSTSGKTTLVAARSQQETEEVCPTERVIVRQVTASRNSQPGEARMRARAEAKRATAKEEENTSLPETVEVASDNREEVANLYTVPVVNFSEREQKALRAAGVHARGAEKIAEAASRGSLAAFAPGNEAQLKLKQMEMDRLLRQRTRINVRDKGESLYEIQTPNTVGSM